MEIVEKEIVFDWKFEGEDINYLEVKYEGMEVDGIKEVQKIELCKDGGVENYIGVDVGMKFFIVFKFFFKLFVRLFLESVFKLDNNIGTGSLGDNKVEVNNYYGSVQIQFIQVKFYNIYSIIAVSRNVLEI